MFVFSSSSCQVLASGTGESNLIWFYALFVNALNDSIFCAPTHNPSHERTHATLGSSLRAQGGTHEPWNNARGNAPGLLNTSTDQLHDHVQLASHSASERMLQEPSVQRHLAHP